VTQIDLTGTVVLPDATYRLSATYLFLGFPDGASLYLGEQISSANINYLTPSVGGTMSLEAYAYDTSPSAVQCITMLSGLPPTSFVTATIPTASSPLVPADVATGVNLNTDFSWSAFASGIHLAIFRPAAGVAGPTYWVFTGGTTTKIPELSTFGLGLPGGGAGYVWYIYGFAPFASMDAFASANNLPFRTSLLLPLTDTKIPPGFPLYKMCYTNTPRTFTTQ